MTDAQPRTGLTIDSRTADGRPDTLHRILAALAHRWPVLLGVVCAVLVFGDGSPPVRRLAVILAGMPVVYLVFGALRRQLRGRYVLAVQVAGLLAFGAVALLALSVDPDLGRYVVAAGWFGHGVWDVVHHRTGRVVPRWYAEWCGVVDMLGGTAILLLA